MQSAIWRGWFVVFVSLIVPASGQCQVPVISSLSPTSITAGGPLFTLTVNGANFVPQSIVYWNASPRTTTFLSSAQLRAVILAQDVVSPGTAQIVVINPGGNVSSPTTFTIDTPSNPVPVITSIFPNSVEVGGPNFYLQVYGSGFVPTSVVQCNGAARITFFLSSSQLRAAMVSSDIAVTAPLTITVINPAPGGGTSNALVVQVSISIDVRRGGEGEQIPTVCVLHQNHPNPFNPRTSIQYDLPRATEVRLTVYNMLGREVSKLVDGRKAAGGHEVEFDGSTLPSGVYLYRLETEDFIQSRKLIILK